MRLRRPLHRSQSLDGLPQFSLRLPPTGIVAQVPVHFQAPILRDFARSFLTSAIHTSVNYVSWNKRTPIIKVRQTKLQGNHFTANKCRCVFGASSFIIDIAMSSELVQSVGAINAVHNHPVRHDATHHFVVNRRWSYFSTRSMINKDRGDNTRPTVFNYRTSILIRG